MFINEKKTLQVNHEIYNDTATKILSLNPKIIFPGYNHYIKKWKNRLTEYNNIL